MHQSCQSISWLWPDELKCLEGGGIKLEPLAPQHIAGLTGAAGEGTEAEWDNGYLPRPENMQAYVTHAISERDAGKSFPFAVCLDSGRPIGTSWYRVFDTRRKKVEIGFTWYARSVRKTFVNRQTKLLLMTHAFERLGCILVEFLVHVNNTASRTAMTALGARQDGFLRRVIPMRDGTFGDVVVFSVSDAEWPSVKQRLEHSVDRNQIAC